MASMQDCITKIVSIAIRCVSPPSDTASTKAVTTLPQKICGLICKIRANLRPPAHLTSGNDVLPVISPAGPPITHAGVLLCALWYLILCNSPEWPRRTASAYALPLQAGIRCGLDATSTTKGPARDGAELMWL